MLAATLPAILRWPLVIGPLYAAVVVMVLVMLLLQRRAAGVEVNQQLGKKLAQRRGFSGRRGH